MGLHLEIDDDSQAIPKLFNYYLHRKSVGFVACITGAEGAKIGAGKSYTALRIGELVDDKFTIDDVTFTPREFLERLDYYDAMHEHGRVVVLDEGEITAASNEWHKVSNKAIAQTLQTFRYMRIGVLVVTPTFEWVDSRIRKLVTFWGTTEMYLGQDTPKASVTKHVELTLYNLRTDRTGKELYPEYPLFYDKRTRKVVQFNGFDVGLPSDGLIEAYEAKAQEFKQKHRQQLLKQAAALERAEGLQWGGVNTGDLPTLAESLMATQRVQVSLAREGKVSASLIMLIKRNLASTHASLVSGMINELWRQKNAASRGVQQNGGTEQRSESAEGSQPPGAP